MNTKKCSKCKQEKDLSDFGKNASKKDGYSYWCKVCQKEYKDKHYQNNKKKYFIKAKKRDKKLREWFAKYKNTLCCKNCGENHVATLDFHHIDNKKENISTAVTTKCWGKSRILKEIEKCVILCANCHRILHYEEKTMPSSTG